MKVRTKKAGVLALAAAAAMAVGGAGSARASLLTPCSGSSVSGEGAVLQGAAQAIWTVQFNRNTNAGSGSCTAVGAPTARYTVTTSDGFVNGRWGADGVQPFNNAVQFGGTDQAPSATQIANLNVNLRASALTIPVAQVAIAILANPQTGCTVRSISTTELEQVFRGAIAAWNGLADQVGCTAANTITRVVTNGAMTGTTYQLKHYLSTINSGVVCASTTTWRDLQADPNNWPAACNYTGVTYESGTGGGAGEVSTVAATPGAIGYAALPDARAGFGTGNFRWIPIKTGSTALTIVDPSTNRLSSARANSNCTTTSGAYGTLPLGTASWAGVYLVGGSSGYPLCTLTWDLASSDYSTGAFGTAAFGRAIATTVHDYLNYVNQVTGGTADALTSRNDYAGMPTDVRSNAATTIGSMR